MPLSVSVRAGPLGERPFRLLFLAEVVSFVGTAIAPVALAFAVLDLTGSATALGGVLAARTVPQVLFVLAGGVLADRLPRQRVMIAANVLSGLAQAATAALLLTGAARLGHLVVLGALNGVASAAFYPAARAVVPQAVTPGRLQQANALLGLSRNATTIGGAALGGLLVAVAGPGVAIALDGASYLAGAAILVPLRLTVPPTGTAPDTPATGFLAELRDGWAEVRSRTWLWAIVAQFAFVNAAWSGAFGLLGPVVADRRLGGPAAWGLVLAANGAGLLAGGLLALRVRPRRPLRTGTLAVLPVALPLAVLALGLPAWAVAAAAFLSGVGIEVFEVQWVTALQEHVPADRLSRVSAYDALGSFVFIPVGYALAGPLAERAGVTATIWGAAALVVTATALALCSADVRRLRRAEAPVELPGAAHGAASTAPGG